MELQISFNDVDIIDGDYYAASNTHNGLYRFNEDSCELICKFGDEEDIVDLFMQTAQYEHKIIFTPSNARGIYVYDIKKNKLNKIDFVDKENRYGKFHGVVIWKHYAFLLCHFYIKIIKLDLLSLEIEDSWEVSDLANEMLGEKEPKLTYGYIDGNIMYAPRAYSNVIFEINLNTNEIKSRVISNVSKIWGYYIKDSIEYVYASDGIYIMKDDVIISEWKEELLPHDGYLFSTIKNGKNIYFIPFKAHYSIVPLTMELDENENSIVTVRTVIRDSACSFGCVKIYENELYMMLYHKNSLIRYKEESNQTVEYTSSVKCGLEIEQDKYRLSEWITLI